MASYTNPTPFRAIDVMLNLSVVHPTSVNALGTMALLNYGAAENSFKRYQGLEEIEVDFDTTTDVYKIANAYFAQANPADFIYVANVAAPAAGEDGTPAADEVPDVIKVINKLFYKDWHFLMPTQFDATRALALSNYFESVKFKFLVLQVAATETLAPLKGNSRTIGFVHPDTEQLAAAVLGNIANDTVGSVIWRSANSLVGITPQEYEMQDYQANEAANVITYVEKSGIKTLSQGVTLSGEYIDALHGDDWIASTMVDKVQAFLINAGKVPFNATGIAMYRQVMYEVLTQAREQGIIKTPDGNEKTFDVTTKSVAELDPKDVANRDYKGGDCWYERESAIEKGVIGAKVIE